MDNLPTTQGITPLLTKSLPQRELHEHRADVCVIMEAMVRKHDKFGWDQMNAGMRQMIREDWLAALQDYPANEVRRACRLHTQEMPNKVPNEGHIREIVLRERSKAVASQPKPIEQHTVRPAPNEAQRAEANKMAEQFARRAMTTTPTEGKE